MDDVSSLEHSNRVSWALPAVRAWSVYMGLCHLGSLLGFLIPLLFRGSLSTLGSYYSMNLLGLLRDMTGIITVVALFIGLRSARFGLMLLLPLNTAYFLFWAVLISLPFGLVGILFGLTLYVPPLILIHKCPKRFR